MREDLELTFARIYDQYWRYVHSICRRYTQTHADDLAQDVFMNVWQALPRFEPQGADPERALRGWIGAIARNTGIDYYERERIRQMISLEQLKEDSRSAPEGVYEGSQAYQRLMARTDPAIDTACLRLSIEKQMREMKSEVKQNLWSTLRMKLDGYTHLEIAAALGRALRTVDAYMIQVRAELAPLRGAM